MKTGIICRLIGLAIFSAAAIGCGVIPSAYRGKFQDNAKGAVLELKAGDGMLMLAGGSVMESKAKNLKFEQLMKGQQGIYVSENPAVDGALDVYWVNPDVTTKQQDGDLAWYKSEVVYTVLNVKVKAVDEIELLRCQDGTILLDLPTKRWQVGCPANPEYYKFQRVSEK
ncbi:MAG: hypothetical protein AABZ06_00225 [Bdellovibrionota bacterium]